MVPAPECSSGLNPPKPFWQGSVLLSSPPKGQAREGACQRGRIPRGTSRFANVLLESNDNPAHHGPPCLDGLHLFRTPRVLLAQSLLPCQDADATGFTGCCSALQYPGALFCVLPLHRAGRQAGRQGVRASDAARRQAGPLLLSQHQAGTSVAIIIPNEAGARKARACAPGGRTRQKRAEDGGSLFLAPTAHLHRLVQASLLSTQCHGSMPPTALSSGSSKHIASPPPPNPLEICQLDGDACLF